LPDTHNENNLGRIGKYYQAVREKWSFDKFESRPERNTAEL